MVIRSFLEWLQNQQPDLSQSEIARRSGLSQSVINKVLVRTGTRDADPATYRMLSSAFLTEWEEFKVTHPEVQRVLAYHYDWARVERVWEGAQRVKKSKMAVGLIRPKPLEPVKP